MNNEHTKLVDDIVYSVGSLPYVRCWVRNVGYDSERQIKYGIPGEADIQGIIDGGFFLAIEVKTGNGKLRSNQIVWKKMVEKFGGCYIEARSVKDALDGIGKFVQGLS